MILPRNIRLYNNKAWLTREYLVLKKSPDTIAAEQGVGRATIYRKLKDFGLIK
jgi:transcriptional regulator of acetoin/glycerol metabolism